MLNKLNLEAVELLKAFIARRPVAFVGAGMTRQFYPDWNGLIEQLSRVLGIPMDPSLNVIRQAERFYQTAPAAYEAQLIATFGSVPTNCRAGLKALVTLDFAAFLTTNYDYSIHYAFMSHGGPVPVSHCYPDFFVFDTQKPRHIFFVHGAVKDSRIPNLDHFILHETAYLKAYFQPGSNGAGQLMKFLVDTFSFNDVLFIGYGLRPDEPVRLALKATEKMETDKQRLILLPKGVAVLTTRS